MYFHLKVVLRFFIIYTQRRNNLIPNVEWNRSCGKDKNNKNVYNNDHRIVYEFYVVTNNLWNYHIKIEILGVGRKLIFLSLPLSTHCVSFKNESNFHKIVVTTSKFHTSFNRKLYTHCIQTIGVITLKIWNLFWDCFWTIGLQISLRQDIPPVVVKPEKIDFCCFV